MRFRLAACVAAVLTLHANAATADEAEVDRWVAANPSPGWVHVGSSGTYAVFFRTGSCTMVDGNRRCWFREEHFPGIQVAGKAYLSVLKLAESDCSQRRSRYLQQTAYAQRVVTGASFTVAQPTEWFFVAPGTIGELLVDASCR